MAGQSSLMAREKEEEEEKEPGCAVHTPVVGENMQFSGEGEYVL